MGHAILFQVVVPLRHFPGDSASIQTVSNEFLQQKTGCSIGLNCLKMCSDKSASVSSPAGSLSLAALAAQLLTAMVSCSCLVGATFCRMLQSSSFNFSLETPVRCPMRRFPPCLSHLCRAPPIDQGPWCRRANEAPAEQLELRCPRSQGQK